jgi:hypothetical protein
MSTKGALRKIQIEDQAFLFRVTSLNDHWIKLKIWSSSYGSKNNLIQVRLRFDDPWLNYQELFYSSPEERKNFALTPVTPKLVRQIIEAAITLGWDIKLAKETIFFDWANGQMKLTADPFERTFSDA